MRQKFLKILIAYLFFSGYLNAQTGVLTINMIENYFQSFEYDKVIELADKALEKNTDYTRQDIIRIYKMKAIAHYSKQELDFALSSFIRLLEIAPDYNLDPVKTSPKIIDFFQQIRQSYQMPEEIEPDTVFLKPDTVHTHSIAVRVDRSRVCSIFVPGTGHMLKGETVKGVVFTSLTAAALGLSLSSWLDCCEKERAYLNAVEPQLIADKYKQYNKSFKKRNTLLIVYAGIWSLCQIDLLLFQNDKPVHIGVSSLDGCTAFSFYFNF